MLREKNGTIVARRFPRLVRRARPLGSTWYPRADTASKTRCRVRGLARGSPLRTRETVPAPTPASSATSFTVGLPRLPPEVFNGLIPLSELSRAVRHTLSHFRQVRAACAEFASGAGRGRAGSLRDPRVGWAR